MQLLPPERRELLVPLKAHHRDRPVCESSQEQSLDSVLSSAERPGPPEAAGTVSDKVQGRMAGVLKEENWPVPWIRGFWMEWSGLRMRQG